MDFKIHLQQKIDDISCYLRDPQHKRTGKTYGMCVKILIATEEKSHGRILVFGIDERHLKNLYSMLIRVADATATTYTLISQTVILINGCDIVFEESKNANNYAGAHPTPQRFVDHLTEEQFVLDRLRRLRDDFALLKSGQ